MIDHPVTVEVIRVLRALDLIVGEESEAPMAPAVALLALPARGREEVTAAPQLRRALKEVDAVDWGRREAGFLGSPKATGRAELAPRRGSLIADGLIGETQL